MKYPYTLKDGHIIFEVNDKIILLDTGAPSSVGQGPFEFNGSRFDLKDNYLGLTKASLSELAGFHIDVLMGADIVGYQDIYINSRDNILEFSHNDSREGLNLPLEVFMGIPLLDVNINGKQIKAFFDTGAKLSYVDPETVAGLEAVGRTEDFYPGVGQFDTDIYRLKTVFGEKISMELDYGILPSVLRLTLTMANVKGIVGTEIFKQVSCLLSIKRKELLLVKN